MILQSLTQSVLSVKDGAKHIFHSTGQNRRRPYDPRGLINKIQTQGNNFSGFPGFPHSILPVAYRHPLCASQIKGCFKKISCCVKFRPKLLGFTLPYARAKQVLQD